MSKYAFLSFLLVTGCTGDIGKDKVDAIAEANAPSTEKVAEAPAETNQAPVAWSVDLASSSISALGAKVVGKHPIDFHDYTGTLWVAGGKVVSMQFEIQMASLTTDHPKLQEHLLNEDFFWVDQFPTATFESSSVAEGSNHEGMSHTVSGDLTVRGLSKEIQFPAGIMVANNTAKARTEFVVDRQDFDITYPGKADNLVQDNVVLTIGFTATPSAP